MLNINPLSKSVFCQEEAKSDSNIDFGLIIAALNKMLL